MAVTAQELQQARERRAAAQAQQQPAPGAGKIQAPAHLARLDYTRQYQDRELSERDLFAILQKKMLQWQRETVPAQWQIEYISGWHAAILADQQRREATRSARDIAARMPHFGALLKFLRERSHSKQQEIADKIPANHRITMRCYGAFERRTLYVHFDDLAVLYKALIRAGVEIRPEERAAYILLARQSIETKRHHKERISPARWEKLTAELAAFDDSAPLLLSVAPPAVLDLEPAAQPQHQAQPVPEVQRLFIQVAGELGAMLSQLASLSQQVKEAAR